MRELQHLAIVTRVTVCVDDGITVQLVALANAADFRRSRAITQPITGPRGSSPRTNRRTAKRTKLENVSVSVMVPSKSNSARFICSARWQVCQTNRASVTDIYFRRDRRVVAARRPCGIAERREVDHGPSAGGGSEDRPLRLRREKTTRTSWPSCFSSWPSWRLLLTPTTSTKRTRSDRGRRVRRAGTGSAGCRPMFLPQSPAGAGSRQAGTRG